MRTKLISCIAATALSATMAVGFSLPVASAAPPDLVGTAQQPARNAIDVVATNAQGTLDAVFTPTSAAVVNDQLVLTGNLVGTFTPTAGPRAGEAVPINLTGVTATITGTATQQRQCPILSLDLGPLNLDLLGLVVDLSAIDLDIVAVPGPGNLLGNLLCAIVGLLDDDPTSGLLDNLLAQLNRLLGG